MIMINSSQGHNLASFFPAVEDEDEDVVVSVAYQRNLSVATSSTEASTNEDVENSQTPWLSTFASETDFFIDEEFDTEEPISTPSPPPSRIFEEEEGAPQYKPAFLEEAESCEEEYYNLLEQYDSQGDITLVSEGKRPEQLLGEVHNQEHIQFRKYYKHRRFFYISSAGPKSHPILATPRKHKASSASTARKEADFAEKILEEMDTQCAEIDVKDFLKVFCPGRNMSKKQLKMVGNFTDLDTSDESKMYPTLVRTHSIVKS
jgi:hypothetical protein